MKKLVIGVLLALSLTACGGDGYEESESETATEYSTHDNGLTYATTTIPGGRTIECIIFSGYNRGGVSCNWINNG